MNCRFLCAGATLGVLAVSAVDATAGIRVTHWNSINSTIPLYDMEVQAGGLSYNYDPSFEGSDFQPAVTGNVSVNATFGLVQSRVDLTMNVDQPNGGFPSGAYSRVRTEFSDQILINSDTQSGTGTGTWLFVVHGSAFADAPMFDADIFGNSRAYASTSAEINGFTISADAEEFSGGFGDFESDSFDQIVALPFTFTFGVPFELSGVIETEAYVGVVGNSTPWQGTWTMSADADFSRTFEWAGIGSVLNSNGELVSAYELTSDSGTDWTQPIPAPGTSLLIATAAFTAPSRRR